MTLKGFSFFLALAATYSVEQTDFDIFGRRRIRAHFCEIILKSVHWSRRRCHLKDFIFLALAAI